jgi:uncharacterized membrane protein YphA (DoxX/SURF4 family)
VSGARLALRWSAVAARIALGAVMLAAGVLKAAEPTLAVMAVGAYGLLPPTAVLAVGFLLPGVEIAVGAALVVGFLARGGAILAAALSATFLFVTAWAHVQGLDIECGCFGALSPALASGLRTALLDAAMLAVSIVTWLGARRAAPGNAPS